MQHRYCAEWAE